jgi:hypothetical protein
MQKMLILATWLLLSTTQMEQCREGTCTRVDKLGYPIIQVVKTFVTKEECAAIQGSMQREHTHLEAHAPTPSSRRPMRKTTTYSCLYKED